MWFDHVHPSSSAVGVMTNEQLTAAVLDLGKMVAVIHGFLLGPQPNPPPPSQQQQLPPPQPSLPSFQQMLPISYQYGMPYDGTATTSFLVAPTPLFQDV